MYFESIFCNILKLNTVLKVRINRAATRSEKSGKTKINDKSQEKRGFLKKKIRKFDKI